MAFSIVHGNYLIAEPEKAILDWIYLGIQNGAAPALDELDFGGVDRPDGAFELLEIPQAHCFRVGKYSQMFFFNCTCTIGQVVNCTRRTVRKGDRIGKERLLDLPRRPPLYYGMMHALLRHLVVLTSVNLKFLQLVRLHSGAGAI
jgi:hypothetical protein